MIKKIIVLIAVFAAAYIVLPFGFGLWNEEIGVRGYVTFAESPEPSPEQSPEGETGEADADKAEAPDETQNAAPEDVPETVSAEVPEDGEIQTSGDNVEGEDIQEAPLPEEAVNGGDTEAGGGTGQPEQAGTDGTGNADGQSETADGGDDAVPELPAG